MSVCLHVCVCACVCELMELVCGRLVSVEYDIEM